MTAGFHLATAIAAIAALVIAGRYLINPMFRIIANTGAREVMIAAALFVVLVGKPAGISRSLHGHGCIHCGRSARRIILSS